MPEIVFEDALFCRHLGAGLHVLPAASATYAKVPASRGYPRKPGLEDAVSLGQFEAWLFAIGVVGDRLPRQRPLDEDDFSLGVRNSAAFLIEGFYINRSSHLCVRLSRYFSGTQTR